MAALKRSGRPFTPRSLAWRRRYLPPDLVEAKIHVVATHLGLTGTGVIRKISKNEAPDATRVTKRDRWSAAHCPPELHGASLARIAEHYGVATGTVTAWIVRGAEPRRGGHRAGLKRSPWTDSWIRAHAPAHLHESKIDEVAAHFEVSTDCIRTWISTNTPPRRGGWKRGKGVRRPVSRKTVRPAPVSMRSKPPPKPAGMVRVNGTRASKLRDRFFAEIEARRTEAGLARIFTATIRGCGRLMG